MASKKEFAHILTGKHPVLELLERSPHKVKDLWIQKSRIKDIKELLELCQKHRIRYHFVPRERLDRLSSCAHQGIVARIYSPGFMEEDEFFPLMKKATFPFAFALDHLQDQGNIGVLARTLYCVGGAGIVITKDRCAHLGERAFKSSAGALAHIPLIRVINLKRFLHICGEEEIWTYYASSEEESVTLYEVEVNFPAVLVLGNEEKGIRPAVKKACDMGLKIPMVGNFDSLNVAQAGGMILGEFWRQWLKRRR